MVVAVVVAVVVVVRWGVERSRGAHPLLLPLSYHIWRTSCYVIQLGRCTHDACGFGSQLSDGPQDYQTENVAWSKIVRRERVSAKRSARLSGTSSFLDRAT